MWSFCGKCYDWWTIEGSQLVIHNVIYHYQKFGYIFCGRSMLKRVRNVTEMVPWRRLVAYYSCFMLYNVYVCLHFAAVCDNLHRTVISHSLLWNSSRFGVIFSIPDAKSLHRILLVHNNGFCVILDYRSRLVDTLGSFQYPIKRVVVRSREVSEQCDLCLFRAVRSFWSTAASSKT